MPRGFCTCKRDFPGRLTFHPPAGAAWHYLCDKPVLPAPAPCPHRRGAIDWDSGAWHCYACGEYVFEDEPPRFVPTGTGWPVT